MNITTTIKRAKTAMATVTALATLAGSARAIDQQGELQRHRDNTERLQLMNPGIRPKIRAVLTDMEHHGYRPLIDAGVWRSAAQEAAKKASGVSKVSYGFHNCTTPAGKPDSLAADITDNRWFWGSPTPFWLTLAGSAESHDLTTGIYWGLSQTNRNKIHAAIKAHDWDAHVSLGWDTAHVQPANFSIAAAKAGKRPFAVKPRVFLNGKQVSGAYMAYGRWYTLRGQVAAVLGFSEHYPSLAAPLRNLITQYGYSIDAINNRLITLNRYDIRVHPVKK